MINVQNCSHGWQKRADQCCRKKYNLGHQQDLLNFSKKIYLENQPDTITKYENKINENKKFSNRHKYVYEHGNICMFHQAVISKCRDQWNSSRNIYPHFILRTIILIQKYNFIYEYCMSYHIEYYPNVQLITDLLIFSFFLLKNKHKICSYFSFNMNSFLSFFFNIISA